MTNPPHGNSTPLLNSLKQFGHENFTEIVDKGHILKRAKRDAWGQKNSLDGITNVIFLIFI